jgi:hypothetical protein
LVNTVPVFIRALPTLAARDWEAGKNLSKWTCHKQHAERVSDSSLFMFKAPHVGFIGLIC